MCKFIKDNKTTCLKFCVVVLTILVCLCLQIKYNNTGYNYFVPAILCILILYFKDIKKISVAGMSVEKYEQLTNDYKSSVILFYKTLLEFGLYTSKSDWYDTNVLWENYTSMARIYDEIPQLPSDIQMSLKKAYKNSLEKAIHLQINKFYYQGTAKKPTKILPFEQLEIAEKQKEQENFEQAKTAYIDLYKRYQLL